jgi:MoaA/NifB/PqqE/SkfB family radical SAM enzyme
VHVTRACNLRCAYCYLSAGTAHPDELSAAEYAAVWDQLVALRPRKVVFTGGEPLLRPDLVQLLVALRAADPQHHVRRCLNTNGHLVTSELAERLVGLADEVRVSVDALADRNDAQRGPGSFGAAMAALECLHGFGFEPKALVTVTEHSLPDLEDLLCLLHERRIDQVKLNGLRPIGRGRRMSSGVDRAEVDAAVRRAWSRCYPDRPPPPMGEPTTGAGCGVGRFLNIMPNGDVFPCHALTSREFRCGNVRRTSIHSICRRGGPLDRLASLDPSELRRQAPALAAAGWRGCLGDLPAGAETSITLAEIVRLRPSVRIEGRTSGG